MDAAPKLSGTVLGFRAEPFKTLKSELYNYEVTNCAGVNEEIIEHPVNVSIRNSFLDLLLY